jgi:hypothetical protein
MNARRGHLPRAVARVAASVCCLVVLACAPWAAPEKAPDEAGGELLPPPGEAGEGAAHYRLTLSIVGESDRTTTRATRDPEPLQENFDLELLFEETPTRTTAGDASRARIATLLALREVKRSIPPPQSVETEIANDRIRILHSGEKRPILDLRGAQPKEALTPRHLLGKPFALIATPPAGRVTVAARGTPAARELMRPLRVTDALGWMQVDLPDGALEIGRSWTALRFPPNPVGALGLELQIRHTLIGIEDVDGVRCGHLSLEADLDQPDARSAAGFTFDRATARVKGEAWFELASRRVRRVRLDDDVRAAESRSVGKASIETRYRYGGRGLLELARSADTVERWSDGAEPFGERER